MSVIHFRIYDQIILWLFFFLLRLAFQQNGTYSVTLLLQNGACFTTCLVTKWRWFHDLPCLKVALIGFPPSGLPEAS
jgi:hypothetical protein